MSTAYMQELLSVRLDQSRKAAAALAVSLGAPTGEPDSRYEKLALAIGELEKVAKELGGAK